jgi:sugar lactone lactonase YvrE
MSKCMFKSKMLPILLAVCMVNIIIFTIYYEPIKSYAQSFDRDRLYRIGFGWQLLRPGAELGSGSGIALDSKGNVYVLDRGHHWVAKYDPNKYNTNDFFVRGFLVGTKNPLRAAITLDKSDNLYVVNASGKLIRYNQEGFKTGEFNLHVNFVKVTRKPDQ